ncbi:ProQ/FINO family protein [Zooshikella harenae]|uniref:ProQ/FinO family protein n=1 Tax=Zooshikella harenae TaxID=2827238 RepID=A0ABS5ZC30_9GAMM|nr:ProQ/FinO family protein [Zooshikella harenae]MBU2711622.1 ProQ/FinO family protein [Zooshikella harenae]
MVEMQVADHQVRKIVRKKKQVFHVNNGKIKVVTRRKRQNTTSLTSSHKSSLADVSQATDQSVVKKTEEKHILPIPPELTSLRLSGRARSRYLRGYRSYLLLAEQWPKAFDIKCPKPLKVGIKEDLLKVTDVSEGQVKQGLRWYCHRSVYEKTLKQGAVRIDQFGEPAGLVSKDEAKV